MRPASRAPGARRAVAPLVAGAALLALLAAPVGAQVSGGPGDPDTAFSAPRTAPGMSAQELDDLTARVASQLRCPVCRNQSVLESSATLSRQMQAEIRRRLAEGSSPEEVKAYFVDRYGEWVLLKPQPEGLNLLVYLFPALAVLGGALLVWRLIGRWAPGAAPGPDPGAGELDPEVEREVEAALGRDGDAGRDGGA